MPSKEVPETAGNDRKYPKGGSFAELLSWHLSNGTRPEGSLGRPGKKQWTKQVFAGKVGATDKTVRNWLNGAHPPQTLVAIERELFGENETYNDDYDDWRFDLRRAYSTLKGVEPKPVDNSLSDRIPIPPKPAHFLGRDADVATLCTVLLAEESIALLVRGGPGIGKTSLTKAIGNAPGIAKRFGEARWFVELENATSAAALQDALTRALGLDPKAGFAATLTALRTRPGLIVLDNLETPWEPITERAATHESLARLAEIPGLCLLASFRGEAPVGGAAWRQHSLKGLKAADATALFRCFAPQIPSKDPDLPGLIAALGGIPLAIELVARQNLDRPKLADLKAEWDALGAELAVDEDFPAGRLSSLPYSIELSVRSKRMTQDAFRLFQLLGQLPAGLCAQDRDALLGKPGFKPENVLRGLGLAFGRENRLDLLPPIRDHARRHHKPEPSDDLAWPRHYLTLTRERGEAITTQAGEGAVARLTPEFPNIDAAIRTLLAAGRRSEVMGALDGLGRLTSIAALPAPILGDLATGCRAAGDGRGEARCIHSLGDIAVRRSDHEAAREAFEAALVLFRKVSDLHSEANCIFSLGNIALKRSDHETARIAYEVAQPIYRKFGDLLGEANCTFSLGEIALQRSDHETARIAYEAAKPLYRKFGDLLGEANCIKRQGDIALKRSDHETARAAIKAALQLYRHVGSVLGEANCIKDLGDIAFARLDHKAARDDYEMVIPLYRQIGDLLGEANCIKSLGDIAMQHSDHEAARVAYEAARPLYCKVGHVIGEANCIKRLGDIARRYSDHQAARIAYEAARPLYCKVGDLLGQANCRFGLGEIAMAWSDHDSAHAAFEAALVLYRKVSYVIGEANCICSLGDIAFERSDHETARTAYETALPLYRKLGHLIGEANCIHSLGGIACERFDYDAARAAVEEALQLYRKVGDLLGEANCVHSLGAIAFERSDRDAAHDAFEEALQLYRQIGAVLGEANCIQGFGDLAAVRALSDEAKALYEEALSLYRRIGDRDSERECQKKLVWLIGG